MTKNILHKKSVPKSDNGSCINEPHPRPLLSVNVCTSMYLWVCVYVSAHVCLLESGCLCSAVKEPVETTKCYESAEYNDVEELLLGTLPEGMEVSFFYICLNPQ